MSLLLIAEIATRFVQQCTVALLSNNQVSITVLSSLTLCALSLIASEQFVVLRDLGEAGKPPVVVNNTWYHGQGGDQTERGTAHWLCIVIGHVGSLSFRLTNRK